MLPFIFFFFFFNDTATTEIYTLSLHDALPISLRSIRRWRGPPAAGLLPGNSSVSPTARPKWRRSEEHTSELQSRLHLVCRLLLEKKKNKNNIIHHINYELYYIISSFISITQST